MRHVLASLALGIAAISVASPAHAQLEKNKLTDPDTVAPPQLRVAPGYEYMAGNPAGTSVNVQLGNAIWLAYFNGEPGKYVGQPGAPQPGTRPVWVDTSTTPSFDKILGTAPYTPNTKGHIQLIVGGAPLGMTATSGHPQTYYLRVRTARGVSTTVAVTVTRTSVIKK